MSDTHYTPTIDEFHDGFEYERMNGDRWEEAEFDSTDGWGTLAHGYENEYEEIDKGLRTVRVKHLDREDIESLGFKHIGDAVDIWYAIEGRFDMGSWTCYRMQMHYGRTDNRMYIVAKDLPDDHKVFEGIIKNKSELVKLMKQIRITDEV